MFSAIENDPAERVNIKKKKVRISEVGITEEVIGDGISQTSGEADLSITVSLSIKTTCNLGIKYHWVHYLTSLELTLSVK